MTDDTAPADKLAHYWDTRLFRWLGAIAAVIAIPAFLISFPPVQGLLFNNNPEVELTLISEIPVFDVRQPLPGLAVTYNNSDLTSSRRSLVASRLRIQNTGGTSLTPADLTPQDPLGFRVEGGQTLRITRTNASSEHLRRLFIPRLEENRIVLSEGLIFDPGDFVDVDILVLKPTALELNYMPLGKVSRQDAIPFFDRTITEDAQGFTETAFGGGVLVHLVRLVTYAVVTLGFLVVIITIAEKIDSTKKERQKRRRDNFSRRLILSLQKHGSPVANLATAIFLYLGYHHASMYARYLSQKYVRSPDVSGGIDTVILHGDTVRADYDELQNLFSKNWISVLYLNDLLSAFKLMNETKVSGELTEALRHLLNSARAADTRILGNGMTSFEESHFVRDLLEHDSARRRARQRGAPISNS